MDATPAPPPTTVLAHGPGRPQPFTLDESARRMGHYRWIEMRLFEALGRWVQSVPELEVKVHLGARSREHAWHADLWHDRLPVLSGVRPDELTVPASEEVAGFMCAVATPPQPDGTIERLVGVYRVVLPHLVAAYASHLRRASPVCDAPAIRTLRLVLSDEQEAWTEGEALLQAVIRTPDDVERAAARQTVLTKSLLAAGGIVGP